MLLTRACRFLEPERGLQGRGLQCCCLGELGLGWPHPALFVTCLMGIVTRCRVQSSLFWKPFPLLPVSILEWPYTLNPQPSTLNPQPSTLNPQPSTLNPQPSTLNPQPSTLNPQPSTPALRIAGDMSEYDPALDDGGQVPTASLRAARGLGFQGLGFRVWGLGFRI